VKGSNSGFSRGEGEVSLLLGPTKAFAGGGGEKEEGRENHLNRDRDACKEKKQGKRTNPGRTRCQFDFGSGKRKRIGIPVGLKTL